MWILLQVYKACPTPRLNWSSSSVPLGITTMIHSTRDRPGYNQSTTGEKCSVNREIVSFVGCKIKSAGFYCIPICVSCVCVCVCVRIYMYDESVSNRFLWINSIGNEAVRHITVYLKHNKALRSWCVFVPSITVKKFTKPDTTSRRNYGMSPTL